MKKAPDKQRLVLCSSEQDYSKYPENLKDSDRQKALIELSRKWVRYGCAETPKEALRMLLGGKKCKEAKHG
jgi:hypothetical protein